MNKIDKLIRHYVLEIIFTIVIVTISIPIWNMFNKSDVSKLANSYATMDYLYLDINKSVSSANIKDVISISNDTNTLRGYNLVLKIKNNNIDNNTILTINNKEYALSELEQTKDKEYNYYNIKAGNLVAGKENIIVEYKNSTIDYNDVQYNMIENHEV